MALDNVILFKDQRPDSLFLVQVYDPDRDGLFTDTDGKIIPNPGSIVIDEKDGSLYYVESVDKRYKSTLKPCRIIHTEESSSDEIIRIISYGNDKFYAYFDDRVKPTKINIDSKLIVFGSSLAEYRLVRTNTNGEKEIISMYMDTNEAIHGERIPLADIGHDTGAKQLTNCHTLFGLQDGDTLTAEIYDNVGVLCLTVLLYTKRSTILNDLASSNVIITDFNAYSNQMYGTDFYLYQTQDVAHLAITPQITYSDGSKEDLTIDNISCYMYGLENFQPSFPGQRQKILIKKYLNYRQTSPLSIQSGDTRYITCEKMITVLSNVNVAGIKVSVIPVWDATARKYKLRFIAYSDRRDRTYDVTNYTTIVRQSNNKTFDGTEYNAAQKVMITVNLDRLFNQTGAGTYAQTFYISLKEYNKFQRYILSDYDFNDTTNTTVYGVEAAPIRRPVILYDTTEQQYYIPTSRFENKAAFLESFYYNASPLFDTREGLTPPVPTHFTVRRADNLRSIISSPIPVDQYSQAWNIILTDAEQNMYSTYADGGYGYLCDWNVIVEFLKESTNGEYQILYGVPVDVYKSTLVTTDYNTNTNN